MSKYKLRFNLGKGKNYMKWKITHPSGKVDYLEPNDVTIVMKNCLLRNQKSSAQKIFDGANKTVCAWIEAERLMVITEIDGALFLLGDQVSYNPRVAPNWIVKGEDADGKELSNLVTDNRKIFTY
jgi:hypothetical protein